MIQAILRGKLSRDQENMEDILTSNVFGLLRYVPPHLGLFKFLAAARNLSGETPLAHLATLQEGEYGQVGHEFWPVWREPNCIGCEPDVAFDVSLKGTAPLLVAIEAKYLSGKSSEADDEWHAPTDQLAREWDNLRSRAIRANAKPYLVFLTADFTCPEDGIQDSLREWGRKRADDVIEPNILWLSWRQLARVTDKGNDVILRDLGEMLERLNLKFFSGVTPLSPAKLDWEFLPAGYCWSLPVRRFGWRFSQ